jgi:hypothetical protein
VSNNGEIKLYNKHVHKIPQQYLVSFYAANYVSKLLKECHETWFIVDGRGINQRVWLHKITHFVDWTKKLVYLKQPILELRNCPKISHTEHWWIHHLQPADSVL